MCYINTCKNCCCIIRVYIGNKVSLHFEGACNLCPIFQGKIHGARAQIRATDTYLNYRCKLLTSLIDYLTCMHLIGKISNALLLSYIKLTLVDAVSYYIISLLTACKLVKNQTLLTSINNLSRKKSLVLVYKLSLISKRRQGVKNLVIYLLGSIIVYHTRRHRH